MIGLRKNLKHDFRPLFDGHAMEFPMQEFGSARERLSEELRIKRAARAYALYKGFAVVTRLEITGYGFVLTIEPVVRAVKA